MHADFQELLKVRDNAPTSAEVRLHVAGCPQCRLELGRLQKLKSELRQLPQFVPPQHVWPAIRVDLDRLPNRPRRSGLLILAAAILAGAIAVAFLWSARMVPGPVTVDRAVAKNVDDDQAAVAILVVRSEELENILRTLPRRPSVQRAATSAAIDDLQLRIQVLDQQIFLMRRGDRDQSQRAWKSRVELLSSLVSVRYAEAVQGGYYESASPTNNGAI
jgi:hypothetical protein